MIQRLILKNRLRFNFTSSFEAQVDEMRLKVEAERERGERKKDKTIGEFGTISALRYKLVCVIAESSVIK